MEVEVGRIVKLRILHFRKAPGYVLVYKKTNTDYILLSITGQNKTESINFIIPQHPLIIKLSGYKNSFVNLNTLVLIENDFFFELLRRTEQPKEKIQLPDGEFEKISRLVEDCFRNELYWGNLYKLSVLPNES